MGVDTVSYRGLEVVGLDKPNNVLVIKGGVPGPVGALVRVENIGKIKGYVAPPEEKPDEEEEAAANEETNNEEVKAEENADPVAEQPVEDAAPEGEQDANS